MARARFHRKYQHEIDHGCTVSRAGAGRCPEPARWWNDRKRACGGIVAVVPGRFAIAAFSPRLNEAGNSVRSMKAIQDIAAELGVGVFGPNPD